MKVYYWLCIISITIAHYFIFDLKTAAGAFIGSIGTFYLLSKWRRNETI